MNSGGMLKTFRHSKRGSLDGVESFGKVNFEENQGVFALGGSML